MKDEFSNIKYSFVNLEKFFGNEFFKVSIPVQSGSLTYNGSIQSPAWLNFDTDRMTLSGVTTATNAGDYTVVFTLGAGFQWADGTTEPKNVQWSIQRAAPTIIIDTAVSVRKRHDSTHNIQFVTGENPTFSIISADSDIATGTVDSTNNSFTVHGAGYGDTTLTLTTAQTANYAAANIPIEVTVTGQPDIYTTCLIMGEELPVTDEITGVQVSQPEGYSVSIDTSIKKFDNGSIYFPTKYQALRMDGNFSLGGQDFTIDWWLYVGNPSGGNVQMANTRFFTSDGEIFTFIVNRDDLRVYCRNRFANHGWPDKRVTKYQWMHFAYVYQHSAGKLHFFRNGSLDLTDSGTISRETGGYFTIGQGWNPTYEYATTNPDFRIDHFRVSDGIARWTSNFTPPTIDEY